MQGRVLGVAVAFYAGAYVAARQIFISGSFVYKLSGFYVGQPGTKPLNGHLSEFTFIAHCSSSWDQLDMCLGLQMLRSPNPCQFHLLAKLRQRLRQSA